MVRSLEGMGDWIEMRVRPMWEAESSWISFTPRPRKVSMAKDGRPSSWLR